MDVLFNAGRAYKGCQAGKKARMMLVCMSTVDILTDVYIQGMHETYVHAPICTCRPRTYTHESSAMVTGITGTEHPSISGHKSRDGAEAEIPGGVQSDKLHQSSESDDTASEDEDTDTAYLRAIEAHEEQRCATRDTYLPAVPVPPRALVPKLELSVVIGAGRDASGPAAMSSAGEAIQGISGAPWSRCEPGSQEVWTEKKVTRGIVAKDDITRGIVAKDDGRRFLGQAPLVAPPEAALKPHTENKYVVTNVPTGSAAHTATAAAGTSPPPPPPRSKWILCILSAFFTPIAPHCACIFMHG